VKILVAADDLGSRLVAQSAVQALGHECITAANGDEAWQLTTQLRPDVVVTDRDMPGLDGITLCRRIRAEQQHGYTYIILLTALDHPDQVLAGMVGGADDYLAKPLKPFDLQTRCSPPPGSPSCTPNSPEPGQHWKSRCTPIH